MSYMRCGYPLTYVEGNSEDYVFERAISDGKGGVKGGNIEDYGSISDAGIVEMLFENWQTEDVKFKEHLLRRLADRLEIKLRKKPLTEKQWEKLLEKVIRKSNEKWKVLK